MANDAVQISQVILTTLRESNAQDYSPSIIAQVAQSFSPEAVAALLGQRQVFVAVRNGQVAGTASLDGQVVRTVFVRPNLHGQGIGRQLMAAVERVARDQGIAALLVPSSVTAERFYLQLGFQVVREAFHGEERTIVMQRSLT